VPDIHAGQKQSIAKHTLHQKAPQTPQRKQERQCA